MMEKETEHRDCLVCHKDSMVAPLFALDYKGSRMWVCPQHVPVLIHNPQQLAEKYPWAKDLASPPAGDK